MSLTQSIRYFQYHVTWPLVYRLGSLRPVDRNTVLFADSFSTTLTDNMRPVYDALQAAGGYTLKTCLAPRHRTGKRLLDKGLEELQTLRFLWAYSTAGTLVLTETHLPAYCVKRRKGVRCLQLWHGSGAFKKWGYSIVDNTFGADRKTMEQFPLHNCYTLVPVSAAEVIPAYADAFHCAEDLIRPLGIPKTDVFFDPAFVDRGLDTLCQYYDEKHPGEAPLRRQIRGRKVLLYAPTFRGDNIVSAHFDTPLDLEALRQKFGDDYVFFYKLHPYAKDGFQVPASCRDFAFNLSGSPADAALCAADALITDYSSIIFEYSLLDRPMVFYAYDLAAYTEERNFYYPYRDFVPGPIAETQDALEEALAGLDAQDPAVVSAFRAKFMAACDGQSTGRIAKEITKA